VNRSRNKFAFLFLLVIVLALALYALYALDAKLHLYVAQPSGALDMTLNLLKIVLWAGLAIVFVRALTEIIFGLAFRLRRGYEASNLVRNIFSISVYLVILAIIFKRFGFDLGALFTTSAIFGVIIGLALQETLGNLFAGLSLHADKPFQVGDVVTLGGRGTGVVESVTWRGVKIRTFQHHILLVSNSSIAKEMIEVCPRHNLNARIVLFNTLYTDSPAKTIQVVREAVREAENVSQMIAPVVRIRNFGDSSIEYEVKYWPEDYARHNDTDALIRQRIWYAFRRAQISFAFPTRTIHIERDAKHAEMPNKHRALVERLSAISIFAPLSETELTQLASATGTHIFAPGETVIRAGDKASSMFVINRGCVEVRTNEDHDSRTVATLNEGDFFGEMALFTGEPRTANVLATEETEVLEIGHQAIKDLFESNPDLVESLSHTIVERRLSLMAKQERTAEVADESAGIFASIKRFFGIN
jgi:small-conductance mechanosensitive channel